MRIKSLLIFGVIYKVYYTRIKGGLSGDCDPNRAIIRVCPLSPRKSQLHTLLHEMIHAVIFRTGIFQALDHKSIETICENIATAILENFKLIKKNK